MVGKLVVVLLLMVALTVELLVVEPVVLLVPVWFVLALGLVLLMLPVSHRRSYSVLGLTVRLVAAMVLVAVLLQMDLVGLRGLLLVVVELVLWAELLQMDLVGLRGLVLVVVELVELELLLAVAELLEMGFL